MRARGSAGMTQKGDAEARLVFDALGTPAGLRVLALLRQRFVDMPTPLDASDALLQRRAAERDFVLRLERLAAIGGDRTEHALRRAYPDPGAEDFLVYENGEARR